MRNKDKIERALRRQQRRNSARRRDARRLTIEPGWRMS